jgi:hypothetical protein
MFCPWCPSLSNIRCHFPVLDSISGKKRQPETLKPVFEALST